MDLSPISANAFRQRLSFLVQLGVPLDETEVLFVLNPFEVGGSIHLTPDQIERFANEELHRFIRANSPGPIPHLTQVRTGYPRVEILATLKKRHVDLAILGTLGRSGFERLTVGSVAARVMHEAGCNLLIVPPEASLWSHEKELTGADWEYVSDEELGKPGRPDFGVSEQRVAGAAVMGTIVGALRSPPSFRPFTPPHPACARAARTPCVPWRRRPGGRRRAG